MPDGGLAKGVAAAALKSRRFAVNSRSIVPPTTEVPVPSSSALAAVAALVRRPGYRLYLWQKLLRRYGYIPKPIRTAVSLRVDPSLPSAIAAPVARIAARLEFTPRGQLENPVSLLGFQIGYLGEETFRYLLTEVFLEGRYHFKSEQADPVIVDCGSNIGMSILFFKVLYPRARIIGFEPDPCTFEQLKENVRVNKLNGIELHNIALAGSDGDIDFFVSSEERGCLLMSAVRERLAGTAITVPARRLSEFLPERVDLMKIDIEGSELSVLGELEVSGRLARINRMHLEYHHHIGSAPDSMSEILALLERNDFGYQIQARSPNWPAPAVFQDVALFAYRTGAFAEPRITDAPPA